MKLILIHQHQKYKKKHSKERYLDEIQFHNDFETFSYWKYCDEDAKFDAFLQSNFYGVIKKLASRHYLQRNFSVSKLIENGMISSTQNNSNNLKIIAPNKNNTIECAM